MSVTFATDTVAPSDRVDFWHSVSCETYIAYECTVEDRTGFSARIEAAALAHLALSVCDNTPLIANRTAQHVARTDTDWTFFGLILEGSKHIQQDGRSLTAQAGDFYLADAGRPYVLTCTEFKSELVLAIPRAELAGRLGGIDAVTARVVSGTEGAGVLASSYLRQLKQRQHLLTPSAASMSATQAIDLVALALTNGSRSTVQRLSSPAAVSRLRLHHAIDLSIAEGVRSCTEVAAIAGLSARYANMLLSQEGTSLERVIVRRRLEKCRGSLADPALGDLAISEIARRWGFDSPSHFARAFRATYGMTARDYRYTHRHDLPPEVAPRRTAVPR